MNTLNTLRLRQDGCHFPDDIFKCMFFNENLWITIKISLKFVPKGPMNNIPALGQIITWRRPGDRPLSEPMVSLLTHICINELMHWGLNKMAAILQTTFSNVFSWMKIFQIWFKSHQKSHQISFLSVQLDKKSLLVQVMAWQLFGKTS